MIEATKKFSIDNPEMIFLYKNLNNENVRAHIEGTGRECVRQLADEGILPGTYVALVGAIGTGGTLAGILYALIKAGYIPYVFGVTPAELPFASDQPPNGLPKFGGSGGLGNGRRQEFIVQIHPWLTDHLTYTYAESIAAKKVMFDLFGLTIGSSAAAVWLAALDVSRSFAKATPVLTVFACRGMSSEWSVMNTPDVLRAIPKIVEDGFTYPESKKGNDDD